MAATSITGRGPGDSLGLYKIENNNGCCGGKPQPDTSRTTTTVISSKIRDIKGCSSA